MCEHCGKEHPEFEDMAADLSFLDGIFQAVEAAEFKVMEEDGANLPTVLPYVIPYFNHATVVDKIDPWMDKCRYQGIPVREAVIMFTEGLMNTLWATAKLSGELNYQPTQLTDQEFAFPTESEVLAWIEHQRDMGAERALIDVPESIRAALEEAGVDLPENLKIRMPVLNVEIEQTGEEGNTGLYL